MTELNDLSKLLKELKSIVGDQHVTTDIKELEALGDWTSIPSAPAAAVKPASTDDVSKIMKLCHNNGVPVVPSGGRTGLAGAAVATNQEILICLDRMNKISPPDPISMSIEVEAGVITQNLQQAAADAGLFFGVDLAAKGSCQIGGNIATNAGGLKLIRYGGMREQVLGLEVVLADGTILDINYNLIKNNSGYDLKHLFIGSEGTLGIITKANLKLIAKPKQLELACLLLENFDNVTQLLRLANLNNLKLTAFEFFTDQALELVLKYFPSMRYPFESKGSYFCLIETEKGENNELEAVLEKGFNEGIVIDGTVASNSTEFHNLWAYRENITEAVQTNGHVRKNDVSLPINQLPSFIESLKGILAPSGDVNIVLFGHIGDGNIHINYTASKDLLSKEAFVETARKIELEVFKSVQAHRGSISAEHGIGLLKKDDLHFTRSQLEVSYMKQIKNIFDPKSVLNPGKIF